MSRQLVIFEINGEEFGIEITKVQEIIKLVEIYKIPSAPPYVEGLINLRNKIFAVFNLRKKFKLGTYEHSEDTKIIMVSVKDIVVGFMVDKVNEILRVEDENTEFLPKFVTNINEKFIKGAAKVRRGIVLLIDLESLITDEDIENLNSISKNI